MSSYKNINNKRITNQSPMLSEGDSHISTARLVSAPLESRRDTGWFCLAVVSYESFGVRSTKHYAFTTHGPAPDTKPCPEGIPTELSLPESMHGG